MLTEYLLLVPVSLFAIVGPVSASAVFLAMTSANTENDRIRTARLACLVATGVLFFFAISGELLFKAIGITVPAFQVAGGILLFTIAMDLLRAQESPTKLTAEEKYEGANKEEIAVTPLGVPLLAGPGAISTVILLNSRANYWYEKLYLYLCISAVMFVSFLILQIAARGARRMSPLFLKVSNRLMGLLLGAIAVQFVFNGIKMAEW